LAALVFIPMLVEARRAAQNEQAQRARGGVEPPDDVYNAMRLAYPTLFAAMIVEGAFRGRPAPIWIGLGLACFLIGKAITWWAILTLGPAWTFRIIVVPGMTLVRRGPYRFLRHPNYVGVAGELVGVALAAGAAVSGPIAVVLFGTLLQRRIAVEERALDSTARHPPCSL